MPGTFVFKPIEANLTRSTDLLGKMSPYCAFNINGTKFKGPICRKGGKNPHWEDILTLPASNQPKILVEVMDKDKFTHDDSIGCFLLDLQEVKATGHVNKWYPLYHNKKPVGEILLESLFRPDSSLTGQSQFIQEEFTHPNCVSSEIYHQAGVSAHSSYSQQQTTTLNSNITGFEQQKYSETFQQPSSAHVFTEKRQIVEPHRFVKEIDVTETMAGIQEVEVMEPIKVIKNVEYVQTVPVKKVVEISEPEVVVKEIEVLEPILVTKTIQVVENVPVKRMIEVVELAPTIKEVQDFEQQTMTKQIEVTEYVPMKKQVEITHPVHLKKAVEYVEPVITTQTITKEVPQTLIIDEKITKTAGPASVVCMESMTRDLGYVEKFDEIRITEKETAVEKDMGLHAVSGHHIPLQHHYHSNQHYEGVSEPLKFKKEMDELGERLRNEH